MSKRKIETETIKLSYDELEVTLVALAIRQEELRDARSRDSRDELEHIWNISDRMDIAQRSLEARMTRQMEGWLASLTETSPSTKASRQARPGSKRDPLITRLARLIRL